MRRNIGTLERIIRGIVGLVILGLYGALPSPWSYLTLVGLMPLGTAITGYCPAYGLIGWRRGRPPTGSTTPMLGEVPRDGSG